MKEQAPKRELSYFALAAGVRLHARVDPGPGGDAAPVVILHGFTGSGESMSGVAEALAADRCCVRVDLVGHGCSDAPEDRGLYSMQSCVEQLHGLLESLDLERPHLLGYSMGGRVALSFCTEYPEAVASVLAVGASPGLGDAEARASRCEADEALADEILREGLPAFVERWMANPLFASQERLGAEVLESARAQRLRNRPLGLANSLRGMGTGAMPPLELSGVKVPVCFVAGEEDEKFRGLARDLAARLASAEVKVILEAGHAAHLENPQVFARVAREFLRQVDGSTAVGGEATGSLASGPEASNDLAPAASIEKESR